MPTVLEQDIIWGTTTYHVPAFKFSSAPLDILDNTIRGGQWDAKFTINPPQKYFSFTREGYGFFVVFANSERFSVSYTYTGQTQPHYEGVNPVQHNDIVAYATNALFTVDGAGAVNLNPDLIGSSGGVTSLAGVPIGAYVWLMVYGDSVPDGYNVTYDLSDCTGDSNNPSIIPLNATVTNMNFTPDSGYTFNSASVWIDGDGYPSGTPVVYTFNSETGNLRVGPLSSDIVVHVHAYTDPYNNPDNPDLIDGEDPIPGADTIAVPNLPGITAVSSGMIGLFNPTASQMQLLADYMWTDFGGMGSTTEDILKEIVQAIKRSISNPLDYVIGLNIIPSQGLSVGSSASVRFGFVNSNVSMPRLTSQYFVVDCGSLSFDKLCGDTFLDYAPYSKFSLYLPYIGVKEMDANDFVGHTISIVYHGDVVTGGVTAYVLKDGSVMYQYSGCCALTVPMNADSWGSTIAAAVQVATSLITTAGSIPSAGGSASLQKGLSTIGKAAGNVASNPSLLSPQVARSGAVSGGAGCMGVQKPFVIREAVRFHSTVAFNTIAGYPSYYYRPLSSMHGFTAVLDVHLHGITGTHEELEEIESLLKEGVIL